MKALHWDMIKDCVKVAIKARTCTLKKVLKCTLGGGMFTKSLAGAMLSLVHSADRGLGLEVGKYTT